MDLDIMYGNNDLARNAFRSLLEKIAHFSRKLEIKCTYFKKKKEEEKNSAE